MYRARNPARSSSSNPSPMLSALGQRPPTINVWTLDPAIWRTRSRFCKIEPLESRLTGADDLPRPSTRLFLTKIKVYESSTTTRDRGQSPLRLNRMLLLERLQELLFFRCQRLLAFTVRVHLPQGVVHQLVVYRRILVRVRPLDLAQGHAECVRL
jgi:hypothetical protein